MNKAPDSLTEAKITATKEVVGQWSIAYGLDASLRHGSLVRINNPAKGIFKWKSILEWDKHGSNIGEKSTLEEIAQFALSITEVLSEHQIGPVLIEFDPRSVYWRSGKRQIVTIALFLGYLVAALHSIGYPAIFITPQESRAFYDFTKGKKTEFQNHFLEVASYLDFTPELSSEDLLGGDTLDALLIGMMLWPEQWIKPKELAEWASRNV